MAMIANNVDLSSMGKADNAFFLRFFATSPSGRERWSPGFLIASLKGPRNKSAMNSEKIKPGRLLISFKATRLFLTFSEPAAFRASLSTGLAFS